MGRKRVLNKNQSASVSLTENQITFIEEHPKFNFSKFVRVHLNDHIELTREVERVEKEVKINVRDAKIE